MLKTCCVWYAHPSQNGNPNILGESVNPFKWIDNDSLINPLTVSNSMDWFRIDSDQQVQVTSGNQCFFEVDLGVSCKLSLQPFWDTFELLSHYQLVWLSTHTWGLERYDSGSVGLEESQSDALVWCCSLDSEQKIMTRIDASQPWRRIHISPLETHFLHLSNRSGT